jgi:serine/threonine protein kinase
MSTVTQPTCCPKCGGPIPPEAPQGLCPKCLLVQASLPTEPGPSATVASVPPTHEELAAAFPHLEILELIGQGGMGFVFKVRQPKIDRLAALKILSRSRAADPAFAERFTREGCLLARLNHPNIVTLYDFGEAGGFFYLLMEYVDGVNLRQAMKVGRFTPAQALAVVPRICEALQFAHNEGVLHRDIKPENILLDAKGRVKIADFGIAKLVGDAQPDHTLTVSGTVLGTPQYMAPEQLEKSGQVDQRADIYSLGVVFYEMLTGELPLGRFQPPSERAPVDARLDEVVLHTLEKEPARRYQQASEVKTAVETISSNPAAAAGPTRTPPVMNDAAAPARRPDRFWKGLALVLLALMAIPVVLVALAVLARVGLAHFVTAQKPAPPQPVVAAPPTNPAPTLAFGPVIERTLQRASTKTNFLLSFQTGALRAPPSENAESIQDIRRWAEQERLDVGLGILNGDNDVLTGFDLAVVPASAECWDRLTPEQAAARLDAQPHDTFGIILYGRERPPYTCIFQTRNGGIGILQLTKYVSDPLGLKLRYKFLEEVPFVAQSPTNLVAPEAWVPALLPGEKPNVGNVLEEGKKLAAAGESALALQRYVWFHNHAKESSESYQQVLRLSSALSEWGKLARDYEPAKQALLGVRDRKTRELAEGRGDVDLFEDVRAINRELHEEDATYALFKTIRENDRQLTDQCYFWVQDLLLAKGDYQWCLSHLGDPQACFDSYRRMYEMQRDRAASTYSPPAPPLRLATNAPGAQVVASRPLPPPTLPSSVAESMRKSSEDYFVRQVCHLVEVLVGAGHKDQAQKIRDQAVEVLEDARLKTAVSDAETRVRERAHA